MGEQGAKHSASQSETQLASVTWLVLPIVCLQLAVVFDYDYNFLVSVHFITNNFGICSLKLSVDAIFAMFFL